MTIDYAATYPLLGLGLFEGVAWLLDPLNVHTDLNEGAPMKLLPRVMLALVNGGSHAFLAHGLVANKPWVVATMTPFVSYIACAQWIFWWWPYLLGDGAGCLEMIATHKKELKAQPRILPAIADHLIPDIEHTLLQPLSMLCVYQLTQLLPKVTLTQAQHRTMTGLIAVFSLLPLGFARKGKNGVAAEKGPLLVMLQSLLVGAYLRSLVKVKPSV